MLCIISWLLKMWNILNLSCHIKCCITSSIFHISSDYNVDKLTYLFLFPCFGAAVYQDTGFNLQNQQMQYGLPTLCSVNDCLDCFLLVTDMGILPSWHHSRLVFWFGSITLSHLLRILQHDTATLDIVLVLLNNILSFSNWWLRSILVFFVHFPSYHSYPSTYGRLIKLYSCCMG